MRSHDYVISTIHEISAFEARVVTDPAGARLELGDERLVSVGVYCWRCEKGFAELADVPRCRGKKGHRPRSLRERQGISEALRSIGEEGGSDRG